MLLKNALYIKKSIQEYRLALYNLVKEKGINDPNVIKMSQELDDKIIVLQKILYGYPTTPDSHGCEFK